MTPSQIELARKLVAHERWEWRVNMGVWHPRYGVGSVVGLDWLMVSFAQCGNLNHANKDGEDCGPLMLPDLQSDATAGVLLGMWREAEGLGEADALIVLSRLLHSAPLGSASASTHMAELFALTLLDAWATK